MSKISLISPQSNQEFNIHLEPFSFNEPDKYRVRKAKLNVLHDLVVEFNLY